MLTIVGNGPSRLQYDLNNIGEWWGCNQIYKDATPDILFSMDIPQQVDIITSGYHKENKFAVGGWEPLEMEYYYGIKMGLGFGEQKIVDNVNQEDDWFVVMGDYRCMDLLSYSNSQKDNIVIYDFLNLKNLFTGMSALGYAMEQGREEITLIGFDALQHGDVSNVYEGEEFYLPKYTTEDRVFDAQRSQFIALLKQYPNSRVYFKNSLDELELVVYNELNYYESSDEWILGEGFLQESL